MSGHGLRVYGWLSFLLNPRLFYDLLAVVNMVLGSATLGAVGSTLGRFLHAEVCEFVGRQISQQKTSGKIGGII